MKITLFVEIETEYKELKLYFCFSFFIVIYDLHI